MEQLSKGIVKNIILPLNPVWILTEQFHADSNSANQMWTEP